MSTVDCLKPNVTGLNEHVMKMAANSFTPVSDKLIPTGSVASVAGTVFDLRTPTRFFIILITFDLIKQMLGWEMFLSSALVGTIMDLIITLSWPTQRELSTLFAGMYQARYTIYNPVYPHFFSFSVT